MYKVNIAQRPMSFLPCEANVASGGEANVAEVNAGEVNVVAPKFM